MERVPERPNLWRPNKEIRSRVRTRCRNILDRRELGEKYDFIACRILLIYFDQSKIDLASTNILGLLDQKGLLCTGVSEAVAVRHPHLRSLAMPFFAPCHKVEDLAPSKPIATTIGDKKRSTKSI